MARLSVRLSESEYRALKEHASKNKTSMSQAIKKAFFDNLEDQADAKAYDRAYEAYRRNPKTFSSNEVAKELGIR